MKNTEAQTILLIEDNPGDSRLIKEMLKEITYNNYQPIVAETLKEGCGQIRKNKYILILLDLNLPDSRGKQTFDTVMQIAEKTPVVLVSGLHDEELSLSLIEEGAQDYILKQDLNSSLLGKTIQFAIKRKQAEEALLVSNSRLALAMTAADMAWWHMDLSNGNVIFDKRKAEMLGYPPEKFKHFMDFINLVHPEDSEKAMNAMREHLYGKVDKYEIEYRILTHSGEYKWFYDIGSIVESDSNGKPLKVSGLVLDISERKQAEVELKASKDYLDKIINSLASPIFVKDEQHRFCLVNDALCSLLNLPVEKLIGTTGYEYFPDEQMKVFIAKDQEVFRTGKENINEEQLTDGTGKIQNIVTRKTLYTDINGNKFLVGVINNITENRQKENELIIAKEHAEESDRLKSAFLANMSHEIRTPMNGILGFADLLKEPELTGEEQQKYISIIENSGTRMLNIINNIVDISKIEAGQMEVDLKESNVNEQIEYIYTFFKPEVENKGIHLFFKNSLPAKEALIETDREKIFAILTNLVKNAIKYTSVGSIEFGYDLVKTQDAAYLQFFVKDTGMGIAKNRQEAIFERFIQADILDTHAYQGAGLGLAITKAYVEMLGGKIWVESEEGKGSTFYFTIPYNTKTRSQITINKVVSAEEKEVQIKNLKIIIAEDDETSYMLITSMLKKNDHKVLHTKTGIETIEVCRNNPDIDLILMDIRMPNINGHEATRQIRQFNKEVIIIAQTAYGLSGDRPTAIDAGCNEYLSKPIDKDELLQLMQKHFKR